MYFHNFGEGVGNKEWFPAKMCANFFNDRHLFLTGFFFKQKKK